MHRTNRKEKALAAEIKAASAAEKARLTKIADAGIIEIYLLFVFSVIEILLR